MTESKLKRLDTLAKRAMTNPKGNGVWASGGDCVYAVKPYDNVCKSRGRAQDPDDDTYMKFIAAANPKTIAALVAEVRRLRIIAGTNGDAA